MIAAAVAFILREKHIHRLGRVLRIVGEMHDQNGAGLDILLYVLGKRRGTLSFIIGGRVVAGDRVRIAAVENRLKSVPADGKRRFVRNDKPCRPADLSSTLMSVLFCPDDLSLVKGSAGGFKSFLPAINNVVYPSEGVPVRRQLPMRRLAVSTPPYCASI